MIPKQYRKTIGMILTVTMLATLVLSGCSSILPSKGSSAGSIKSEIKAEVAKTIGNTLKDGAALDIPENTFDEKVTLAFKTSSSEDSRKMCSKDFEILGKVVSVKVEGLDAVRLNQPAVITIAIPKEQLTAVKNSDDVYAGYFNGEEWEYILPDSVDLKKGIVKFSTYHFSEYSAGKLSESEQIERFAGQMAVQSWANAQNEKNFIGATKDFFNEAFDKLGIKDSDVKGKLLRSIVKENDFGSLLVCIEQGDIEEFNVKLGEMTATAILDYHSFDSTHMGTLVGSVSAASKAAGLIAGGDYEGAQKEIASAMIDVFPAGRAMKVAIEVIDTAASNWKDSEIEYAYQAYKNGARNEHGYSANPQDFDVIEVQMRGALNRVYTDAVLEYCRVKDVKESSLGKDIKDKIKKDAVKKMKKQFEKRLAAEAEIEKQKLSHAKTIAAFKRMGLLTRGSFRFDVDDNIEDRLRILYMVKGNIREIIGKDIPMDDMCTLMGVWIADKSITRANFFAKLKAMGYSKEAAKPAQKENKSDSSAEGEKPEVKSEEKPEEKPKAEVEEKEAESKAPAPVAPAPKAEYAWVLANVIDKDNKAGWETAKKNKSYDYEYSYGRGAYYAKTIYEGESDNYYNPPYVHGEALAIKAQWSTPPKTIKPGDTVELSVSLGVTSNTQSALKFSGSTRAYFNGSNMVNKDGKHFFETKSSNKYASFNEKVSAKAGSGSKEGDKLEITTTFFMGQSMETTYVYEWRKTSGQ